MKLLLMAVLLNLAPNLYASDRWEHRPALNDIRKELENSDFTHMALKTDKAIANIVNMAAWKLRREGYHKEARQIQQEWEQKYEGYFFFYAEAIRNGQLGDIGDYAPLNEWLTGLSKKLVELLGQEVCDFLRLSDINTLNYTIPIVFRIEKVLGPIKIDVVEYEKHFDPFCGVVAYWSTWAACTGATWGTGIFIICTPAGMIVEHIVKKDIAPKVCPSAYKFFWKED